MSRSALSDSWHNYRSWRNALNALMLFALLLFVGSSLYFLDAPPPRTAHAPPTLTRATPTLPVHASFYDGECGC